MIERIQAFLAGALPGISGEVPGEIQWMPPGRHRITALKASDGGSNAVATELEVEVNEALAQRVAGQLRDYRAKAAAGTEDLPYLDFNHEDREAAGHPTEVFWGGEDAQRGGVRMKVDWTEAGAAALKGKLYRRFSPEFLVHKQTGEILGARLNMGGLVNRAAFKTSQPIWSRDAGDQGKETEKENEHMSEQITKDLAEVKTAVVGVTETLKSLATAVAAIQAKQAAPDGKILVLETQVAGLTEASKVQAKEAAAATVRKAVEAGKIPPQDAGLIEKWTNILVLDAKNAELLDKLPANPALQAIVQAQKTAGTGNAGAEPAVQFAELVKAKHGELKNKSKALDAAIAEKPELYKAWRDANGKPELKV